MKKPPTTSLPSPGRTQTALALLALGTATLGAATDELPARALRELERALKSETGFVQIHAAEALVAHGHAELARSAFADPANRVATNPPDTSRIGKWRVLALSSTTDAERAEWVAKVRAVARDSEATDRLQAVETLGKLRVRIPADEQQSIRHWAENSTPAIACFPWWVLHINGAPDALPHIVASLAAPDPIARLRAAYILKRDRLSGAGAPAAITQAWVKETPDSPAYPYLLCARATLTEDAQERANHIEALARLATDPTRTSGRYEACLTLLTLWPAENSARLATVLDSPDADTRVGAAWAILQLTGQAPAKTNHP